MLRAQEASKYEARKPRRQEVKKPRIQGAKKSCCRCLFLSFLLSFSFFLFSFLPRHLFRVFFTFSFFIYSCFLAVFRCFFLSSSFSSSHCSFFLSFSLSLSLRAYLPPWVGQGTALSPARPRCPVGTSEYTDFAILATYPRPNPQVTSLQIAQPYPLAGCETYLPAGEPAVCIVANFTPLPVQQDTSQLQLRQPALQ